MEFKRAIIANPRRAFSYGSLLIWSVLLLCCGTVSPKPSSTPSEVVTTYIQALKGGDENTDLSCWTIKGAPVPAFKKDLALAALKLGMVAEKASAKKCEYKILEETKRKEEAFVTVERNFLPQNKVTLIKVRLILDDDAWKIAQWGVQ